MRFPRPSRNTAQFPNQPLMEIHMSKVLVLYYSSYGHIETMAGAIADGARSTGATVDLKRVPETAPLEMAKAAHFKLDQGAPIATIDELASYDAIIVGSRCLERESGWCLHVHRHAAWWSGSHAVFSHYQPDALRHDHCGPSL